MFANTKNNTLAAIISLSLLMASMPVKAEEYSASEDAKKTARCAWHVAKIVTGLGSCLAGTAGLIYLPIAKISKDAAIRQMAQQGMPEAAAEDALNSTANLAKVAVFICFIPGIAAIQSGIDGLKQELGDSKKNPKEA